MLYEPMSAGTTPRMSISGRVPRSRIIPRVAARFTSWRDQEGRVDPASSPGARRITVPGGKGASTASTMTTRSSPSIRFRRVAPATPPSTYSTSGGTPLRWSSRTTCTPIPSSHNRMLPTPMARIPLPARGKSQCSRRGGAESVWYPEPHGWGEGTDRGRAVDPAVRGRGVADHPLPARRAGDLRPQSHFLPRLREDHADRGASRALRREGRRGGRRGGHRDRHRRRADPEARRAGPADPHPLLLPHPAVAASRGAPGDGPLGDAAPHRGERREPGVSGGGVAGGGRPRRPPERDGGRREAPQIPPRVPDLRHPCYHEDGPAPVREIRRGDGAARGACRQSRCRDLRGFRRQRGGPSRPPRPDRGAPGGQGGVTPCTSSGWPTRSSM